MRGKNKGHRSPIQFRDMLLGDSDDEVYLFGSSAGAGGSGAMGRSFGGASYASSSGLGGDDWGRAPKVSARNETQAGYMKLLEADSPAVVLGVGSSGSGKTMLACHIGMQKLINGDISKLILTRPAVSVDEEHGFLPGTLEEKLDPWLRPIYDVLYQYMSKQKLQALIGKQVIEICPLAYMRGRTFEGAYVIADELQNSTVNQMLMLLTRIGRNSKLVITGDPMQYDRGYDNNGLSDLIWRIKNRPDIVKNSDMAMVEFAAKDVQRHPIIRKVLRLYGSPDPVADAAAAAAAAATPIVVSVVIPEQGSGSGSGSVVGDCDGFH